MNDKTHEKANEKAHEDAKAKLAEQKAAREAKEAEAPAQGKPTPTQEENDLAAMGVHVTEHEPDGSPEEAPHTATQQPAAKHVEAKKPATTSGYQTSSAAPAKAD